MKKSDTYIDWQAIIKDASLVAFITLILSLPFIGIYSKLVYLEGLVLKFDRVWLNIVAVLSVFVGRIFMSLLRYNIVKPTLVVSFISFIFSLVLIFMPETFTGSVFYDLRIFYLFGSVGLGIFTLYSLSNQNQDFHEHDDDEKKRKRRIPIFSLFGAENLNKLFHSPFLVPLVTVLLIILPFTELGSRTLLGTITLILIYIMLGWGLNIIVGLAGLLDLGYVAFYAVGAYTFALLAKYVGLDFWVCLPIAGLFAAFFGFLLGFPILRLRGDYFAITTLGFGEIIRLILINWSEFTGGPNGISNIPTPTIFGLHFKRRAPEGEQTFHDYFDMAYDPTNKVILLYLIILIMVFVTHYFTMRLRRLPVGRAWEAMREDDIAAQSVGINLRNTKLAAFMFSAMLGGFAGCFFSANVGIISPESFLFMESAIILAIVVLGGFGSQLGIVIGTLIMVGLPEIFREFEQYQMLAFGLGMVIIMLWRPRGLLAFREPTILMSEMKKVSQ